MLKNHDVDKPTSIFSETGRGFVVLLLKHPLASFGRFPASVKITQIEELEDLLIETLWQVWPVWRFIITCKVADYEVLLYCACAEFIAGKVKVRCVKMTGRDRNHYSIQFNSIQIVCINISTSYTIVQIKLKRYVTTERLLRHY